MPGVFLALLGAFCGVALANSEDSSCGTRIRVVHWRHRGFSLRTRRAERVPSCRVTGSLDCSTCAGSGSCQWCTAAGGYCQGEGSYCEQVALTSSQGCTCFSAYSSCSGCTNDLSCYWCESTGTVDSGACARGRGTEGPVGEQGGDIACSAAAPGPFPPSHSSLRALLGQLPRRVQRGGGGMPRPAGLVGPGLRHWAAHGVHRALLHRCGRCGEPVEPAQPRPQARAAACHGIQPGRRAGGDSAGLAARVRDPGPAPAAAAVCDGDVGLNASISAGAERVAIRPRCCRGGSRQSVRARRGGHDVGTAPVATFPAVWWLRVPATAGVCARARIEV